MTRKIICLIIPSFQAGGMERVMSELAGYFSLKKELELHIIFYDNKREIFYPVPGGVTVHLPRFIFNDKLRLFSTLKTALFLRQTVKKIKPDTILSFGEYWNTFVLLSLSGSKSPVFISDRCSPVKEFGPVQSLLRKILYPGARGIVAQTQIAKEYYYRQFRHANIRVIGNPIRNVGSSVEIQKENIVLMVGRFISTKNQDRLIELFLDLNVQDWKLYLVGYDHLKQTNSKRLQEIIDSRGAEEKVILTGKLADVDSIYRRSKLFAFTSTSEGFPNVIGEAMSAGLPVVAFDCIAGPSEMIRDGENGYLVPLNDYKQFGEKLKVLMLNEDLRNRMGIEAAGSVSDFSIDDIGEKYLGFILS
jgi:GalNAc-alpha-(1->4)-GalNAc-alpha-(1->3)-diNAcBac-PP-undecaprenol alpha-1,4-N-acetyl-D-galactosaminyltransferase